MPTGDLLLDSLLVALSDTSPGQGTEMGKPKGTKPVGAPSTGHVPPREALRHDCPCGGDASPPRARPLDGSKVKREKSRGGEGRWESERTGQGGPESNRRRVEGVGGRDGLGVQMTDPAPDPPARGAGRRGEG